MATDTPVEEKPKTPPSKLQATLTVDTSVVQKELTAASQLLAKADARIKELENALRAILADPFGCPMCQSGTLRTPGKQHWESCGYGKAAKALKG